MLSALFFFFIKYNEPIILKLIQNITFYFFFIFLFMIIIFFWVFSIPDLHNECINFPNFLPN
uniref:Uncharacterized protein n=1 Tax=Rhizophora mucronata TaxID=61149 RepID=A0A2P2N9F1_RHIMU